MSKKNLTADNNIKTLDDISLSNKPINPDKTRSARVDIHVLRSKLEIQKIKELRKNIFIFSICIVLLGSIGLFLSL